MQPLYQIDCDPECGFSVTSHKKDETKEIAKKHVEKEHNKNLSDSELEDQIKTIEL